MYDTFVSAIMHACVIMSNGKDIYVFLQDKYDWLLHMEERTKNQSLILQRC